MSSPSSNPPDSLKSELKEIPDLSQHLVEIEIEKDPEKGFGFNIVGGTDEPYVPGCTGIFISRINPEGPAAKDGRLRLGDRIAALNDISLASKTHSDAVDIFRQASGKVRLLIEQDAETLLLSYNEASDTYGNG
uniref:PDZ domain-containing protein n=1 Tax=Panagrolaimus superbus TaxID=310955 RepID=A0A914YTA1_9BILA